MIGQFWSSIYDSCGREENESPAVVENTEGKITETESFFATSDALSVDEINDSCRILVDSSCDDEFENHEVEEDAVEFSARGRVIRIFVGPFC